MMNNEFYKFDNEKILCDSLSSEIIKRLQESIDEKGKASLLVSGGSTPKKLFEKLSNIEFSWEKVNIALVDERWLESSNKDSNEYLIRNYLLKNKASKANFVGMYFKEQDLLKAEKVCSLLYEEKLFPLDVLILGMGNDAHTASLFPDNERLKEAFDLQREEKLISIKPVSAPYNRMSLSLKSILSSKSIFLHIQGEEKLKVYVKALAEENIYHSPISAVLNNTLKKIEVYYS